MRLSRESMIIFTIGIADLATTLMWVHNHGAQEANPIFSRYLAMGPLVFSLMKLVMLCAPIFLLEWARRTRPVFTRNAARFAIAAYLGLYCIGFAKLNMRAKEPAPTSVAMADIRMGENFAIARR